MTYCTQDEKRMEKAFKLYFHRANIQEQTDTIDILVCHANVIRYFICRYHSATCASKPSNGILCSHVLQSFAAANCNVGVCDSGELLSNCHQD